MALVWGAIQFQDWLCTDEQYGRWHMLCTRENFSLAVRSCLPSWRQFFMYLGALIIGGVSVLVFDIYQEWIRRRRKRHIQRDAFPFMKLPAELRAEVFSYLIEPTAETETYRTESTSFRDKVVVEAFRLSGDIVMYLHDHSTHIISALHENPTKTLLELLGYDAKTISAQLSNLKLSQKSKRHPLCLHLNNLRLVSKQFSREFFTTYLIHASPVFTAEASEKEQNPFGLWQHSLPLLKKCTLRLVARPDIANGFNPMDAQSKDKDWPMRDAIFASMRQMRSLQSMTLNIEACGNQLWNPVQLWYFVSQRFKRCDVRALERIEFTMKDWKINSGNYMVRRGDGGWEWRCHEGHFSCEDEWDVPIRRWALRLYEPCAVCDGSATSDED